MRQITDVLTAAGPAGNGGTFLLGKQADRPASYRTLALSAQNAADMDHAYIEMILALWIRRSSAVGDRILTMGIKVAIAAIVTLANSGAHATYLTYSQWAALDNGRQAVYTAGALGMLTDPAPDAASSKQGIRYRQCLLEGKMSNGQLSENVLTFAHSFPDLQKLSAQAVPVQYLNRLCGLLH